MERKTLTTQSLRTNVISLLLFVFMLNIYAHSPEKRDIKISLDLKNVTMEKVFSEIEKLTDLKFFYKSHDVNLNSMITIKVEQQNIDPVLTELFKDHYLTFKVIRNKIILKKNKFRKANHLSNQIIGKIIDKKTNKIISNCNIIIQETVKGVSSDDSGSFKLDNITSFPVKLIISHVNYKQEVLNIKEASDIIVELESQKNNLQEVLIKTKRVSAVNSLSKNRLQQVGKREFDKYGRLINNKKSRVTRPAFNPNRQTAVKKPNTKDSGTSLNDWLFCNN